MNLKYKKNFDESIKNYSKILSTILCFNYIPKLFDNMRIKEFNEKMKGMTFLYNGNYYIILNSFGEKSHVNYSKYVDKSYADWYIKCLDNILYRDDMRADDLNGAYYLRFRIKKIKCQYKLPDHLFTM